MTNCFEDTLAREFPFMAEVGIECGEDWYPLLREMCGEIVAAYEAAGKPVDLEVEQVKQKYGELCFYCCTPNPQVYHIVEQYEDRSAFACEICGMPGCLRTDLSWVQTLCEEHYEREKAKDIEREEKYVRFTRRP